MEEEEERGHQKTIEWEGGRKKRNYFQKRGDSADDKLDRGKEKKRRG